MWEGEGPGREGEELNEAGKEHSWAGKDSGMEVDGREQAGVAQRDKDGWE